jgi:hypothetical protein
VNGVRIKGQSFVGFLATLRLQRGEAAHRAVLAGLPPDLREALRSGEILPMGWYSIAWYAELHEAARAACGEGVSREIGREAARSDMTTIYRFILKFFSPETLLKQSSKVFGLFCDGGRCTVEAARKGTARILYTDCPGACRGMWDVVLGASEILVELSGGRDVSAKAIGGGSDGDARLLAQVTWTEG